MDAVQTELYAQQQYMKMGLMQILENQQLILTTILDGELTTGMKKAFDNSQVIIDCYNNDLEIYFADENDEEILPSPTE